MSIATRCTSCQRKLNVQDHLIGKVVKCPHCQAKFQAKALGENGPKTPTPPVAAATLVQEEVKTPPVGVATISVPAVLPATQNPPTAPRLAWIEGLAKPLPRLPLQVFGVIAAILLLAGLLGYGVGSWVADAVTRSR